MVEEVHVENYWYGKWWLGRDGHRGWDVDIGTRMRDFSPLELCTLGGRLAPELGLLWTSGVGWQGGRKAMRGQTAWKPRERLQQAFVVSFQARGTLAPVFCQWPDIFLWVITLFPFLVLMVLWNRLHQRWIFFLWHEELPLFPVGGLWYHSGRHEAAAAICNHTGLPKGRFWREWGWSGFPGRHTCQRERIYPCDIRQLHLNLQEVYFLPRSFHRWWGAGGKITAVVLLPFHYPLGEMGWLTYLLAEGWGTTWGYMHI